MQVKLVSWKPKNMEITELQWSFHTKEINHVEFQSQHWEE